MESIKMGRMCPVHSLCFYCETPDFSTQSEEKSEGSFGGSTEGRGPHLLHQLPGCGGRQAAENHTGTVATTSDPCVCSKFTAESHVMYLLAMNVSLAVRIDFWYM